MKIQDPQTDWEYWQGHRVFPNSGPLAGYVGIVDCITERRGQDVFLVGKRIERVWMLLADLRRL